MINIIILCKFKDPIVHFNESLHAVGEDDGEHDDDEVRSSTPEDYREEDRLLHLQFLRHSSHANQQQTAYPKMFVLYISRHFTF